MRLVLSLRSVFVLASLDVDGFFPFSLSFSTGWLVIMTVWVVARILSSSVEYLSTCLYNSSVITRGSRDSEWKKGVDGLKLILKF